MLWMRNDFTIAVRPSLKELLAAFCRPKYWHHLGIQLDIGPDQLDTIEQNHHGDAQRQLTEMYREWLRADEGVSWNRFAIALETIGQNDAAMAVRQQHPPEMN